MDIYINFDRAAPGRLIEYAAERGLTAFTLVADKHTFAALGRRVEVALRAAGLAVEAIVLPGDEVVPDEGRIVHILMRAPVQTCYLAVGSGVITDLTRFVSHHTRNRFISLPTAPSMDGYATSSNALTIGGLKQSIAGQAPEAIFCDIDTLAAAPRPLIAAGLGDTLAKFTSVNDLRLGHLLWDERWDEAIGQRMEDLAHAALARADEIACADADAVALLIRSLLESGLEMAAFGSSAPGGGSEHHISHCWEMRMLQAGQPALLHGLKVGVGTVIAAGWYARLREMSWDEAARRLARASLPDPEATEEIIRRVYGPVADQIIAQQAQFIRRHRSGGRRSSSASSTVGMRCRPSPPGCPRRRPSPPRCGARAVRRPRKSWVSLKTRPVLQPTMATSPGRVSPSLSCGCSSERRHGRSTHNLLESCS